jgi:hypothetical protein
MRSEREQPETIPQNGLLLRITGNGFRQGRRSFRMPGCS